MKQIINNIDKDPYFKAYIDMSLCYSVIRKDHVSFDNWLFSNMTQLYFDINNMNEVDLIRPEKYKEIKLLDTTELHYGILDSEKTFHKCIIDSLSDGYSAIIELDAFYIPKRRVYKKQHIFFHPNLVYGYSYETDSYILFGYNETGHMDSSEVPAEDLYKSFMTRLATPPLFFLKQNDYKYEIDWCNFSTDLKNYFSTNQGAGLDAGHIRVYGVNAMKMMIQLLDKMKKGEHRVNLRLLTLIYEHKKLMEHKARFLLEKGFEFKNMNVMEKLSENRADADFCRVMLIKYDLNKKDKIIDFIQEKLDKIIKVEEAVLPIIAEEVEKYKRNTVLLPKPGGVKESI